MTSYDRGDVVLIHYNLSPEESRLRPALVLSTETYHQGRQQVVLAAITTNPRSLQPGDTVVEEWSEAGLLGQSQVTGVLLTAPSHSVARRLGTLSPKDMQAVEASLRLSLGM